MLQYNDKYNVFILIYTGYDCWAFDHTLENFENINQTP